MASIVRLLAVAGIALGVVIGGAGPATAHPLGNFTTNRYARVEVGASVVRVHYVLDEAELVAFRERDQIAGEGVDGYRDRRVRELRDGLRLTINGSVVPLRVVTSSLVQPAGQGGLSTLRIEAVFEAGLQGGVHRTAAFEDANGPSLLGWREIVVDTSAGARLDDAASVPTLDRSNALRQYPTDPGVAPLDVRSTEFAFTPGRGADGRASLGDGTGASSARIESDRFANLLASTTSSPIAIVGALLAAFAFGIVHALGPGHGKTVMAAYLVSTQGRRRDAFFLGGVVSLMHTASVLALAALLATVGRRLDAARLYPALTLVAGLLVTAVGLRLLARRWRTRLGPVSHGHDHDQHEHQHDAQTDDFGHHVYDDGSGDAAWNGPDSLPARIDHRLALLERSRVVTHGHDHGAGDHTHDLPDEVQPLSRAGILALGTSGGLFPSPSAVVVLVGAFALGRAGLGLALIAAFSLGLASMLVAVGLLLVAGRDRLQQSRFALQLPWLPVAGAAAIVVLGATLLGQGVAQLR